MSLKCFNFLPLRLQVPLLLFHLTEKNTLSASDRLSLTSSAGVSISGLTSFPPSVLSFSLLLLRPSGPCRWPRRRPFSLSTTWPLTRLRSSPPLLTSTTLWYFLSLLSLHLFLFVVSLFPLLCLSLFFYSPFGFPLHVILLTISSLLREMLSVGLLYFIYIYCLPYCVCVCGYMCT